MSSPVVEAVTVADSFDHHAVPVHMELHAVITRANPEVTGKIAAQWLGSAHVGPLRQPLDHLSDPGTNHQRQCVELFRSRCREEDYRHSIMT